MNLLVAMPAYAGLTQSVTTVSLYDLARRLTGRGVPSALMTFSSADIAFSRNLFCTYFYDRTECTHLLMVDSDMEFPHQLIDDMTEFGRPVMGVAYPFKREPLEFVIEYEGSQTLYRNGFIRASAAGTGIMMIARECIERLLEAEPGLSQTDALSFPDQAKSLNEAGLTRLIGAFDRIGKLAEDISFCRRWTACGGEIWVNTQHTIGHAGTHIYRGRLADRIESLPVRTAR